MDNFKLNQGALELSTTQTSYKLAKDLLLTKEELAKLSEKYIRLNEMLEDILLANKVLQSEVDSKQQAKTDNWRVQYELEC